MSKITKPVFTDVWASAGSKSQPDSLKIQTGWIGEKPPYEYWNWSMNRQDVGCAYSFQMGIPEWDSTIEYQYAAGHKSYVQRNGLVYKALQTGANKDPLLQPTYWGLAFDNYGVAATVQNNLNTHVTNYGTLASLSNVGTARTNLSVYSKTEGDARYAALAGLSTQVFNVANGTTTYQAVNYSQLITKAALAGSSGQEFAVATATTGNSAVNKTQFDAKTGQATTANLGITRAATQAEVNALTNTTEYVAPATAAAAHWAAKAWVVFDATGSIKASYNVSSVVRNSVGDFTITFTTAMPNADYCFTGATKPVSSDSVVIGAKKGGTLTAGAIQIDCWVNTATPALEDPFRTSLTIFA